MKTRKFCPHCGRPVVKSQTKGYCFQCYGCEEDFYRFEVASKKDIAIVRKIRKRAYSYERTNNLPHISFKRPYPPNNNSPIKDRAKKRMLERAEDGSWEEKALGYLSNMTDADFIVIAEFVDEHWENLDTDENNLQHFKQYINDNKTYAKESGSL